MKNSAKILLIVVFVVLFLGAAFLLGANLFRNQSWPFTSDNLNKLYGEKAKGEQEKRDSWVNRLKKGGLIIHFRHAQREKWETVTGFDAYALRKGRDSREDSWNAATCLTKRGIEDAKLVGNLFQLASIPVGDVISSPSCRALETAMHAFGKVDLVKNSLLHRTAIHPGQHEKFASNLRNLLLNMKIPDGKNIVLSGHGGTLGKDGTRVIDLNETGQELDERDETGFVIIERVNGQLIARYQFKSITDAAFSLAGELPLN